MLGVCLPVVRVNTGPTHISVISLLHGFLSLQFTVVLLQVTETHTNIHIALNYKCFFSNCFNQVVVVFIILQKKSKDRNNRSYLV